MKKASALITFEQFIDSMNWYIHFINKILEVGQIVDMPGEKRELIEALVFKIHVQWEILVENLLIDCLNRDTSQFGKHMNMTLPKHLSRNTCGVMISGLGYFDVKSISNLKKIAKNILVSQHNPFQSIPKFSSKKIDEFYKIRNYLAHYSNVAERALTNVYKNSYSMKQFREPGDFLIAIDRKSKQIRLGNYMDAFLKAATEMANFLNIEIEIISI